MNSSRHVHFFCAAVVAAASLVAAGAARADVTSPVYSPWGCQSDGKASVGDLQQVTDAATNKKFIKNVASTLRDVYCPITKTTSGPGITNDAIKQLTADVTTVNGAAVYCVVDVMRTNVGDNNDRNFISPYMSFTARSSGSFTANSYADAQTRYWDANGIGGGSRVWYYPVFHCQLPPGASLGSYSIVEAGTAAAGYVIKPMLDCPLTSNMLWNYLEYSDSTVPGGYYRAQASGNLTGFRLACSVSDSRIVDVAVGPMFVYSKSGCNLDSTTMSNFGWSPGPTNGEWPSQVLPISLAPRIYVPATGTHTVQCGQDGPLGDTKWLSYRYGPPTRNFTVTASVNAATAGNAKDGAPGTRWTTGRAAKKDDWFEIDFTGPSSDASYAHIVIDSSGWSNDYARQATIYQSYDHVTWSPVVTVNGTGPVISQTIAVHTVPYLRIQLDQGFSNYWSINEIYAFDTSSN